MQELAGGLAYLKFKILPEVLRLGFPATPSATGSGIYSHGGRVSPTRARIPDSAIIRQGRWYSSTMVAKYTRGEVAGESALWLE